MDKTIIWEFSFIILERSFTGKKPPDEINVKAKFKELKDLIENRFRIMKIKSVNAEYNKKILIVCLKISELSKEVKFVLVVISAEVWSDSKTFNAPLTVSPKAWEDVELLSLIHTQSGAKSNPVIDWVPPLPV